MRFWSRLRNNAATQEESELREFIYLDEVSVTSLLSSRLGGVPSEFTDTLTELTKTGINSSLGASAAFLKTNIGSNFESSLTQDTKVLSKATIQATFKRLRELESDRFALNPSRTLDLEPNAVDVGQVLMPSPQAQGPWVINSALLKRGCLAELEVELQADRSFQISAIADAFTELITDSNELAALIDSRQLETAVEMSRVLEKLMIGLIPLKCRVIDYVGFKVGQQQYLLHRKVLQQLPLSKHPTTHDVYLVGVVERSLFWRDIRRVLFSESKFSVLCRLNHSGLAASWTPVKLAQIFKEVAPGIEQMTRFDLRLPNAPANKTPSPDNSAAPEFRTVVRFAELFSNAYDITLDADDHSYIETLASKSVQLMSSVADRRKVLDNIIDRLSPRSSQAINREKLSDLREQAHLESSLQVVSPNLRGQAVPLQQEAAPNDELFIDAEVIAIYW